MRPGQHQPARSKRSVVGRRDVTTKRQCLTCRHSTATVTRACASVPLSNVPSFPYSCRATDKSVHDLSYANCRQLGMASKALQSKVLYSLRLAATPIMDLTSLKLWFLSMIVLVLLAMQLSSSFSSEGRATQALFENKLPGRCLTQRFPQSSGRPSSYK